MYSNMDKLNDEFVKHTLCTFLPLCLCLQYVVSRDFAKLFTNLLNIDDAQAFLLELQLGIDCWLQFLIV